MFYYNVSEKSKFLQSEKITITTQTYYLKATAKEICIYAQLCFPSNSFWGFLKQFTSNMSFKTQLIRDKFSQKFC